MDLKESVASIYSGVTFIKAVFLGGPINGRVELIYDDSLYAVHSGDKVVKYVKRGSLDTPYDSLMAMAPKDQDDSDTQKLMFVYINEKYNG